MTERKVEQGDHLEIERDGDGRVQICTGCGTVETVASIRARSATAFTCCPERKMVRAVPVGEDRLAERRAVVDTIRAEITRIEGLYGDEIGMTDLRMSICLKLDDLATAIEAGAHVGGLE